MTKFWRLQNLTGLQSEPSWYSYGLVVPYRPADEDGWDGYWWANRAERIDIDRVRVVDELDFLVRAEDVERARTCNNVDIFVPGLFGCKHVGDMIAYIEQVGGVDSDQFICLYEGNEYPEYEAEYETFDGAVFEPIRLLAVYPAREWLERGERGEFNEDVED